MERCLKRRHHCRKNQTHRHTTPRARNVKWPTLLKARNMKGNPGVRGVALKNKSPSCPKATTAWRKTSPTPLHITRDTQPRGLAKAHLTLGQTNDKCAENTNNRQCPRMVAHWPQNCNTMDTIVQHHGSVIARNGRKMSAQMSQNCNNDCQMTTQWF